MGLIQKLLGSDFRDPPATKWSGIIETIHSRLDEERQPFFRACVELLTNMPDVTIKRPTISSDLNLAILVYQLMLCREMIAAHQYIKRADGQRFVTMLYDQALSYGPLIQRDSYLHRYNRDDKGGEIFMFYSDIATYITDNEAPLMEAMLIMEPTIDRFTAVTHAAAASAFGDSSTVRGIVERLKQKSAK